jgi:hypothetical protein
MRPHLFSKVLSLYDRVVHHQAAPAVAEPNRITPDNLDFDIDVADDEATEREAADDDESLRVTTPMAAIRDEGELYGVHTPAATDRVLPDADHAFEVGQNWTEALEERSAEGGPLPEHEIDVIDETVDVHPNSETKDRPIADLGSGGRGGL